MDIIEKIYNSNKAFVENDNFKGVKKIIVDNYSDEAHFIYEMLQNADDAEATEITFDLRNDELIVIHNGVDFNEKDLEGICSINKGVKSDDYTKIGKFGIGFKSVFVYTESPQIYSGNYSFEIHELILPRKIEKRMDINAGCTVFVLPFNAKKTSSIARERISKKLNRLHEEAILFLNNIKKINTIIGDDAHTIEKVTLNKYPFHHKTEYQHIKITKLENGAEHDEEKDDDSLFYCLFKRKGITLYDTDDEGELVKVPDQSVMIAYLEENDKIVAINDDYRNLESNFFVFFPTRIPSNCEFYIHAPFVTKSSRDTIAENNDANDELKKNIGILIADSMIVLAKEKSLNVQLIERLYFPVRYTGFIDELIYSSFKDEYKQLLSAGRAIIPCENGIYKSIKGVLFTSEDKEIGQKIVKLFGTRWLSDFFNIQNQADLCYVDKYSKFFGFIKDTFECKKLDVEDIIYNLDASYYEEQTSEWFRKFAELLVKKIYYGGYEAKYRDLDTIPLVRTKDKKHRTAKQSSNLYLNNGSLDEAVLSSPQVMYLYREVFKLRDYSTELSEAKEALEKLTTAKELSFENEVELLHKILIAIDEKKIKPEDLEDIPLFWVINQRNNAVRKVSPKNAWVGKWERTNGIFDLYVLCKGVNIELIDRRYLDAFSVQDLQRMGCKAYGLSFFKEGKFTGRDDRDGILFRETEYIRPLQGKANNKHFHPLYQMEYLDEILKAPMSIEKSVIILRLAKEFDSLIKDWIEWSSRSDYASKASFYGYGERYSEFGKSLINNKWLFDKQGNLVKPEEVFTEDLAPEYKKIITADIAELLKMKRSTAERLENWNKELENDGLYAIPIEEREAYEEFKRQRELRKNDEHFIDNENEDYRIDEALNELLQPSNTGGRRGKPDSDVRDTTSTVIKDIVKKTKWKSDPEIILSEEYGEDEDLEIDQDEYTPAPVDYRKRIEREKRKSAAEIDRIAYFAELEKRAVNSKRYSYEWFNTLLEMETIESNESNSNSKEISISFAKIEREPGKERICVLKYPNRYIPQFMEDLSDIPMILHIDDHTETIAIEVANIKSYTLRVKVKNSDELQGIDFEKVSLVTINAKSPAFLLEELRNQFAELGYEDDFDMRNNLCSNIEFVFGPPGTGKTTHLARNVILPFMKEDCKVLVLTPTNKAADILVRKIAEEDKDDRSYEEWLVRFGVTNDEDIEQSPVFKDKTYDIRKVSKNVTVTTIARFPYDFFMPSGKRIYLREINWDYIVIDEASMIPIANIVYPLYRKTPQKFIVAGDPFQIEPITAVDLWKNENIYTLVNLDSFGKPDTIPHKYKVKALTTQYRSVPDIGYIFSNFAYDGILSHYRSAESQRQLNLGNYLGIETLNIIKFPVSRYESIYKSKRLQHSSSYQIYSALFTFEYVCYLSRAIAANNPTELFKIGVIAPYKAQANMIDKLLAAEKLPKEIDVQVDTIHGFQGDECDIVFTVFNTPPKISPSKDMFLNKKNIINVSISRARDYLFIVMPDDDTDNIANLRLVKNVERLVHGTDSWKEFLSHDLEKLMFDDPNFLENNSFSTGHQRVNIYGLPENRYEVRTEESAVDVQVHKSLSDN